MTGVVGYPVRWWVGLRGWWHDKKHRQHCLAGTGTRILSSGRIANLQNVSLAIEVGQYAWVAGELLVFSHAGNIRIGDYTYVGEGARIWSAAEVNIGHRVFLAHGVNIHDNDSHSLSAQERHRHFREMVRAGQASFVEEVQAKPVKIEDDVWVGFNSTILKGTCIGQGAIIGACSVVTKDIEPYTIVAGNPAVVIGEAKD